MFNIEKKTQKLFEADGGEEQLFPESDQSDDENDDVRTEYTFKAINSRREYTTKQFRRESRNKGISKISDTIWK